MPDENSGFCCILVLSKSTAMPVNKNAYLRYLVIHSEILRNKYKSNYPNKQDLLWALEEEGLKVSEATLEKDLAFLKYQRFAPIEYNATQRCYLYTEDWNFDIPISPAAIKMMHMLLHKLQIFAESREFIMLRESIEKLSDYFDLSKRYPEPYDKYILFEYTKGFAGKHHLPAIYDAIYGSLEIDFTHCKFDKQ